MKKARSYAFAALAFGSLAVAGHAGTSYPTPTPETAAAAATPTPTPPAPPADDPRSRREQALLKLLEGQRHTWKSQRLQTQAGRANSMRLAKAAFQKAVEIDPTLAEGHTALAELAVSLPPVDLDEGIRFASLAVEIDRQNFGGNRMLARLYTIKSRLNNGTLNTEFAGRAIASWREVARLDPRNAEAWAFLTAFAEGRNAPGEQIDALRKWVSAAVPIDVQFYGRVMGGGASLTPESANVKLAAALAKNGKKDEAATILGAVIADDSDNAEAISLLGEILDSTQGEAATRAVASLQQAVFANPGNISLVRMLARLQARLGRLEDAAALLKRHIAALNKAEGPERSLLFVTLAEIYLEKDRYDDAISSFENALTARGIGSTAALRNEDREFALYVFEKLIHINKLADRPAAVKSVIERARKILARDDLFPDRQMILHLQGSGDRKAALALVRSVRERRMTDTGLVRLEASLLADMGLVDEAVELVRNSKSANVGPPQITGGNGPDPVSVVVPPTDDFSNLLFISNLYVRANRGKEAIETANQAFAVANGKERKQIARIALATALEMTGDAAAAAKTLREVLTQVPGNPIALNNLGYFMVEREENLNEALEMIKQAFQIDPTNPTYLDSLGWAYFKLGKLDEAKKYLSDAVRADVDSSTIYEHLGDVYREQKELGRARWAWGRALRLAVSPAEIERLKKKLAK